MADFIPTKCIFRSCKKDFFEQWQKDKELIDNDLPDYFKNASEDLYEEYHIEDSSFTYDSDYVIPRKSIIRNGEDYNEAELWISGAWEPAPEVAYCLAEVLAQKAGINATDVQIIFTFTDAESYFQLGQKLYRGFDIKQNEEEAEQLFCQAAENGYDKGEIADFYYQMDNFEKEVKWRQLTISEGDAEEQYKLGLRYLWGNGVEENYEEAIKYFKLAAEQGYLDAKIELGFCYYFEDGDDEEAYKILKEAIDDGYDLDDLLDKFEGIYLDDDADNEEYLDFIIHKYEFLARFDFDASTIANLYFDEAENSDDDFAIVCYTYAAKYGHPEAQKKLEELKKKK